MRWFNSLSSRQPSLVPKRNHVPLRVVMHQDVVRRSQRDIARSPQNEVGGKFVGFRLGAAHPLPASQYWRRNSDHWQQLNSGLETLLILGSLPSGPKAQQTPTMLLPDGKFQEWLFRELESLEPQVEHLGSWHSHHPNGLRTFSSGDRHGYAANVSDPAYNLDEFVAALATDWRGLEGAEVDIYRRSNPQHPQLATHNVWMTDTVESLQPLIDSLELASSNSREGMGTDEIATLNRAIGRLFPGSGRPITEPETVSWFIPDVGSGSSDLVITIPRNAPSSAAISLSLHSGAINVSMDAMVRSDAPEIMGEISRMLDSVRQLIRDSGFAGSI